MLYEPTRFDALIDEPSVPARVEDAIAAIVGDAGAAFDPKALWPAHEWDAREKPLPLSSASRQASRSTRPSGTGACSTSPPPWQ